MKGASGIPSHNMKKIRVPKKDDVVDVLGHKVARSGFFGQASKAGRLVLSAPNISTNYRFAKFKWTLLEHGPQGSHAFVLEDCLINLSVVPKKAGTTTVADCHRHNPVH